MARIAGIGSAWRKAPLATVPRSQWRSTKRAALLRHSRREITTIESPESPDGSGHRVCRPGARYASNLHRFLTELR